MRVLLIDNILLDAETRQLPDPQPHLGLIALAASMRTAGHDVVIFDPKADLRGGAAQLGPAFYRDSAERIAAFDPDVAGFTSLGCNFVCTASIAAELRRRRPDLPLAIGGPHASILDREILEGMPAFDVVARGEADLTVVPMLEALAGERQFASIDGLSYRERGEVRRTRDAPPIANLDDLPFPAYDAYPISRMCSGSIGVDAGRGCPFSCTFCSTASFFGRKYRLRSAHALVGMLDRLAATYGIRDFALHHDLFTVNKSKVLEFCEHVRDRGFTWGCSARIDCVDEELLEAMASAGCNRIYYGVEAGSARMQRAVSKNLDLNLLHPRVDAAVARGMTVTASFIIGYPQEEPIDQMETAARIGELMDRHDGACATQIHVLAPEPGTGLLAQYSDRLRFDGYVTDSMMPLQADEDREMIQRHAALFPYYFYFDAPTSRAETIAMREGFREIAPYPVAVIRALRKRFPSMRDLFIACGQAALARGLKGPGTVAAFVEYELGEPAIADSLRCTDAVATLPALTPFSMSSERLRLAPWCATLPYSYDPVDVSKRIEAGEEASLALAPPRRSRWLLIRGRDAGAYSAIAIDEETSSLCDLLKAGAVERDLVGAFLPERALPRLRALAACGVLDGDLRLWGLGEDHVGGHIARR